MCRDEVFEIWGGSLGHFHSVPIDNFFGGGGFLRSDIQKLEKYFANAGFYIS